MSEWAQLSSLRILHLEDDQRDHNLVREILAVENFDGDIQNVQTRQQFEQAVESSTFDVILSDLSLPQYNGMEALAFAREKQPDVPFVFLSGTMGEQSAVDSLRNGATDYVLKEHLNRRLVPALRRALREAGERSERKRAEEALRRSETQYRVIFNSNPLPMWVIDRSRLSIFAVNDSALRCFDYSRQEFLGLSLTNLFSSEDLAGFLQAMGATSSSQAGAGVWSTRKKNGTLLKTKISLHELVFAEHQAILMIATEFEGD